MQEENKNSILPQDDIEYERQLRAQEAEKKRLEAELEEERAAAEKQYRTEYEKTLQDRKIELMKLRQGVIDSSETVKEIHEEKPELTLLQKLQGAWYRSKWLILFVVFMIVAVGYITIDTLMAVKPDYTILVVSDNTALYYRTPELEAFFESYCDDINGDGKVSVMIYNISTDYSDPNMTQSSQAQLMSQLQSGENVLIVATHPTDFLMTDFREVYPDDPHINEYGLLLNCELTRSALKWEAMPDDVYLGVRSAAKLLSTSEKEMQKNIDAAMPVFERIKEAVENSGE